MAKKEEIEKKTEALLTPILEEQQFELVDLEYIKEGSDMFLRAYIDKPGGIKIDDCELVSRALSTKLDEADFIDNVYILEVSSPGLLRPIKKEKDFERNQDKEIEVHLFKAAFGGKEFIGVLKAHDETTVTIETEDGEKSFERKNISLMRPYIDFSDL